MKSCMFEGNFKKKGRLLLALAALFFLLAEAGPVRAGNVIWLGTSSDDWTLSANWAGNAAPTPADDASVNFSPSHNAVIHASTSGAASTLHVGNWSSGLLRVEGALTTVAGRLGDDNVLSSTTGTVTVTGSAARWNNSGDLYVGLHSGGVLNIDTGAQVSANMVNIGAESGSSGLTALSDGSGLNVTTSLHVGYGSTGSLTIDGGSVVSAARVFIGTGAAGDGTVTLSGTNSRLTTTETIYLGSGGAGQLNIGSGATVTSSGGVLGNDAGSHGTATIDGGSWDTGSGTILIGANGQGYLTIKNGGTLTSTGGAVGWGGTPAVTSTATVTGANSKWTSSDTLYVGNDATGILNIQNNGEVSTTESLLIGSNSGSNGTVNLIDSGSKLTVGEDLRVGSQATGVLNLGAGTTATAKSLRVGDSDNGNGTVTISGAGASLTATNGGQLGYGANATASLTVENGASLETESNGLFLRGGSTMTVAGTNTAVNIGIANSGTPTSEDDVDGSLYIENGAVYVSAGAHVTTDSMYVSGGPAGAAAMTVTGPGTSLDGKLLIYVGGDGYGYNGQTVDSSLTISNGATASASLVVAGVDSGTTGTILLTGGSSLSSVNNTGSYTGKVYAGYEGTGVITVSDGASLSAAGELRVGWLSGSSGTVTVESGATMTSNGAIIGNESGAAGTVTGTGAGSTWTNNDEIVVGWSGTGTMNVEAGATVTNAHEGTVGYQAGSHGTVTVTGPGSTWTNGSELVVGWSGTGEMTVANGGKVTNTNGFLGARDGGSGTATVTGPGSTWESSSQLILGLGASTGVLTIENGGKVINSNGRIGLSANSTGTVTVTGANSTLTDNGAILRVGYDGTGTLTIADGGLVTVGTATGGVYDGALTIASNAGSRGTLNIGAAEGSSAVAAGTFKTASVVFGSGTGEIVFNHTDTDLTFSPAISGNGTVKVLSGTTVFTGSNTYSGDTIINAGATLKAGAENVFSPNSNVTVNLNGTLDLNNFDQTIAGLNGSGEVLLGTATLTVLGNSNYNFNISGNGGVTQDGVGTLVLTGNNTYSGDTVITQGNIQAGATNTLSANSTVDVSTGGALDLNNYSQVVGGLTGSGAVTLGSATLTVGNTAANTFSGTISGTGGLTKTGSGALVLTGDNTYTGPTTIQQGTLSLSGASASSSMAVSSGAILDFSPSRDLAYAGSISGGGAVTKTGTGTLTLTGTNSYTGGTTISGGTLAISSDANLGASAGALALSGGTLQTTAAVTTSRPITVTGGGTIDNTGNAVTLSGNLLGSGNLTLAGSGTDTLDATFNGSTYTGTLTRSGGVLHLVSGSTLGGSLAIDNGATLNGVGTVSNLNLNGSVAPGNSPGTLTVTGDYVQGASGVYVCDVTPSANDLIAVTGSATLGGTISIQPEYTYYNSGTVWTVLTAAGGVSGTYSTVTYGATPENWVFVPVYSANAVTVTLARQSYSNSATSSQASSVGSGLDAAAYSATGEMVTLIKSLDYSYGTNAMYSANNALTDYALNVLSPEYYATFSRNVFEAGRLLTGAQRAGLHEGQAGAAAASALNFGPAAVASQNADNGGIPAGIPGANAGSGSQRLSLGRFDVFLKPLGLRASQQGSSDQTGYVTLAGGITGGLLYRPSAELTLGLAPGYVNQSISLHSEGGGQGTINDWSLGLLAAYRQGGFYADAGLRGGYDNFRSSRALPLPAGKYTAKANWDGWNLSASVGGGYDFKAGDFTYGPLASVSWQRLHENGFTEKGAGTIGQSVRARDTQALNTVLGGHVSRTFETSIGDVTPEVRAAWSAQWLGDSQNIVATFIGSPSSTYQAKTKDQRYNSALVDLGVTVGLSDSLAATARVGVELFRPGYAAQAASVGLKFSF